MMIRLVNYGRWYYDHGSTFMPVMVREDNGQREYPDRLLADGNDVCIRNATLAEHAAMADQFDAMVDQLAVGWPGGDGSHGFVSGIGNFDIGDPAFPPERVAQAVVDLKSRARVEPVKTSHPEFR